MICLKSSATIIIWTTFAIFPHIFLFSLIFINTFSYLYAIIFWILSFAFSTNKLQGLVVSILVVLLILIIYWRIGIFLACIKLEVLSCWAVCRSISLSIFYWLFFSYSIVLSLGTRGGISELSAKNRSLG